MSKKSPIALGLHGYIFGPDACNQIVCFRGRSTKPVKEEDSAAFVASDSSEIGVTSKRRA